MHDTPLCTDTLSSVGHAVCFPCPIAQSIIPSPLDRKHRLGEIVDPSIRHQGLLYSMQSPLDTLSQAGEHPLSFFNPYLFAYFIAYTHHHTKTDPSVAFAALVLLQQPRHASPAHRDHRAIDYSYPRSCWPARSSASNKSWSIILQGMFQLRDVNQMERQYLQWALHVNPATLKEFAHMFLFYLFIW